MSAFLCSNDHLNGLIAFAIRYGHTIAKDGPRILRMLASENMRSLQARYSDVTEEGTMSLAFTFYGNTELLNLSPTAAIKLCDCYDYQACETDDYNATDAAAFVRHVRSLARKAGGKTEGAEYDAAQWGL